MIEIKRANPRLSTMAKAFTKKLKTLSTGDEDYIVTLVISHETEELKEEDKKDKPRKRSFFRLILEIKVRTSALEDIVTIERQVLDIIGVPVAMRQEDFLDTTALKMWDIFKERMMQVGISQAIYTKQIEASQPKEENNDG